MLSDEHEAREALGYAAYEREKAAQARKRLWPGLRPQRAGRSLPGRFIASAKWVLGTALAYAVIAVVAIFMLYGVYTIAMLLKVVVQHLAELILGG